uniref:DNA-directed DNA polymerase n=1 Tax=Tanacetum cinerariifolium TaxID=118510 RepID=A0A6L2M337_TANCI|nr:DNA-directed DNA polymerase [Tanacetum cinerariifolium]
MLPVTQIDTFYNGLTLRHRDTINAAAGGTFMKRRPEECYDLIENTTAHHNDWDTSAQQSESSSSITSSFDTKITALKAEMAKISKNLMRVLQPSLSKPRTYMLREPIKVTLTNLKLMKMNTASSSGLGTLPGNIITNQKEELKGITTHSRTAYQGQTLPTTSSFLPLVVERRTEATKDTVHRTNNGSTKDVQPLVVQTESPILNSEPVVAPIIEPVVAPFNKLSELARTPLNEHCSAVLLKRFPEKLRDTGKFLIPCDFQGMVECLALADLGVSINIMPLSVWNKLSLPDLSPTCMTLELADRSISCLVGVAEDVFVKVGMFHFSADFVVVDFDADPRVPLIYRRSFLKIKRDLIDVFEGELTLRVGKEAITFNLDQTSRYSANYNDMTANQIDVIDMACKEYSDSDFLLEEVDAFLALEDDATSLEVDHSYFDPEAKTDKSSIDEPPEVELKDLPPHLEYTFLEGDDKLPVIITKDLSAEEKTALITEDFEPAVQYHRRVNPKIHDVIKNEVLKILDAGLIYPISDSPWVSPVHCVPKKGGFTVVDNEENELIPSHLVTRWRVCIDYRKLNEATRKDHFPLPFMDQMLERLVGNEYYCFLDGFSGYFQIPIDPKDQEKTTFTCTYETFTYHRMPFRLCNAPGTFQRCMMAIFHDMIEKTMKVFMDDFLEKIHFMVKEGIVLGHKISKNGIEVDKAKVEVIAKLPHPTTVKGGKKPASPPQIDHHCCYGCGDSLDGIFNQRCTCKSYGNGAHHGYSCPQKVLIISNSEPFHDQNVEKFPQTLLSFHPTCYSGDENSFAYDSTPNLVKDSPNVFNLPSQPPMYFYKFCGDGAHYSYDCPPQESDEFINSSVENLVPNPSESKDERIDEADCDPEEEIRLIEKLLYDNSSPRPPKEFISENYDAAIKSFSPSPIPIEDSDSLRDEIDLSLTTDDLMPPGIDDDDYDSEGDILILEEFLSNDSILLPENESFHFDIPSSPRPPAKPPDDDDIEPNSEILTVKVVGDIFEHYVLMPRLLSTHPTLASNHKKSPHLLSHRGLKDF